MVGIATACVIALSYITHLYFMHKKSKELASFCIRGDLMDAIRDAQNKQGAKYSIITDSDYDFTKKILDAYRDHIAHTYFSDDIGIPKGMRSILGRDYFMMTLCSFLHKHRCESYFLGERMHSKRLLCKEYDYGGCDAEYALSDFGIVFYKLYYISYLSCKNSKVVNRDGIYSHENNIKKIIDTAQIVLSVGLK
jgi:hypothetical protein